MYVLVPLQLLNYFISILFFCVATPIFLCFFLIAPAKIYFFSVVLTYISALKRGLYQHLYSKVDFIENQLLLREIYEEPPLLSYRKGRYLKNVLEWAKRWKSVSYLDQDDSCLACQPFVLLCYHHVWIVLHLAFFMSHLAFSRSNSL